MSVGTITSRIGLPPYPIWKLTVQDYHRMIDAGVLDEDDRVELLEGFLVPQMPHNPIHDGTIELLDELLRRLLPLGWKVRIQSAITTDDSEPEPDVAVVCGTARSFLHQHPQADDIGLLIEVADSTLLQDRDDKARLYARAGIVEYWIVNLRDRQLEVFRQPSGPTASPSFGQSCVLTSNESVELRLENQVVATIPVAELLP
jgi:Uma2 family endonuclease